MSSSSYTTNTSGFKTSSPFGTQDALEPMKQVPQTIELGMGGILEVYTVELSKTQELSIPIGISAPRFRTRTLVFSSSALMAGILDLYGYLFVGTYIFHPYFAFALSIAGGFLLATTILAIKGK